MNRQTFAFAAPDGASKTPPEKIARFSIEQSRDRQGAFQASSKVPTTRVLGIRNLEIASPFEGRPLVYRTGDYAYVRDPYASFLDTPAESLLVTIRESLRDQAGFADAVLLGRGSSLKPNTFAEISVTRLYGDFRQPQHPVAVLTMRFRFFDAPNSIPGKVLPEREYARSIALQSATPAALMDGWNQALTQVLTEVISDFRSSESEEPNERAQLGTIP